MTGIELGISAFIIAGFMAWVFNAAPKRGPVEQPKHEIETPKFTELEFVRHKDYRTIVCNIPEWNRPIISSNIPIRFMGFQDLDKENPAHKVAMDTIFNIVADKIESSKTLEMKEHLRGDGFFLKARVLVDGVDISDSIMHIPNMDKYSHLMTHGQPKIINNHERNGERSLGYFPEVSRTGG